MSDPSSHPLRLWPDNPTPLDLLGFADIAAPVVEAIRRERLDPVAVGVFGDWGSGKTTVLEILNAELSNQPDTVVVYTRPWEYDPTLDARATLIEEVLERLRAKAKADASFWKKAKGKFENLASRIRWSKAITLASKSAVTFTLPSVESLVEVFGTGEAVEDPTLKGFREEFSSLMKEFDGVTRVVVLVDDLDRCLPETVVMAMEAIKLFLSVRKMAFVIAADEVPVKLAIARHFDRDERGTRMAADYLEKIVQIPVTVPALGRSDTEAYLGMMLLDEHLGGDEAALAKIADHCAERRRAGEHQVFKDFSPGLVPDSAGADLALAKELAPVLFEHFDGNPRRLKRFLNAFWVRADIAGRRSIHLEPQALAKLMVLERVDEDAFGQLLDWLGEGTLREHLKKIEAKSGPPEGYDSAFSWWADLPPKLSKVDLGTYLRLAASLRRRSGPRTELPPHLIELLDQLAAEGTSERNQAQERLGKLPPSERLLMAREVVEAIQRDPGIQKHMSEALAEMVKDDALVAEIATGLGQVDASRVEASLVLALAPEGHLRPEIRAVIRHWTEGEALQQMARNAATEVLGGEG